MSSKQQILLLTPGFNDFSIEHDLLLPTPYELVVVTDETNILPYVSNPLVVAIITIHTLITSNTISCMSLSCRVITRLGVGF
ncbi:unnamed protein product, partial [Rotaria magnacalcarata]